ncbi:MAG: sulfotransferase [Alphaproteobacteria bacterium]|nr:sulfotransferase [Alphaproteobacteria bacterium]
MSLPPETRALPPSPANIAGLLNEAQMRLRRGDLPGAADFAQAVLRAEPRRAEAWVTLCAALMRMGSADDDRALGDALAALPETDPAYTLLAIERCRVLANRGRCGEAVELGRRVSALGRMGPRQHDVLSNAYTTSSLFEDALAHAEEAVKHMPQDPAAFYNRALAHRHLGHIDDAVFGFEKLLTFAPGHALAYYSLSDCRKWTPDRNHIDQIQAALRSGPLADLDRTRLCYALFKEAHDIGDHALAWSSLSEGARLAHASAPYAYEDRRAYTESLIKRFSGGLDQPPTDTGGVTPIFIVGLPRSGTTLVERIFAAHPDVTDMGETHGLALAIRDALELSRFGDLDLNTVAGMGGIDWSKVAAFYLRGLEYRGATTRFFTEKLPQNYHLVGAMRRAFPQARIVHLRRAPMDSLFGAYKILFGESSYTWSYRFEDLASAYGLYRQLTDHWRAELGDVFVEVTLEKLIADPETEIRALLAKSGLSFHEDCLSPHKARGGVSTASSTQVRSPINSQGVGAWRTYETEFEPLRERLEQLGFVDAAGDPVW